MYEEPTVNDHLTQVRLRIDEGRKRFHKEINRIHTEFTMHSAFGGSRMYVCFAEALIKEFETAVQEALGELSRSARTVKADPRELSSLTVQLLEEHVRELRSWSAQECDPRKPFASSSARQLLEPEAQALGQRLSTMLRQFDVGFLEKAEREAVSVSNNNTMNIGTNLGALQQGSHGSTQNASFTLNISEIREALQKVQEELANVPQAVRAKLEPELETVMAQLKKETPSHSILRETGTTIRAIIEGIAGNILTPSFVAAVSALRAALGMG